MNDLEPLPPELAQLRDQLAVTVPSAAMKARVLARVAASGAPWAAAATAAGLAPKLGTWALPLALAAFVSGGVAGVTLERALAKKNEGAAALRPPVLDTVQAAPLEVPPPVSPPAPAAPSVTTPRAEPVVEPRPSARPSPSEARVTAPSGEERQLIEAARTALIKREPTAALHAIARHRAAFPGGQLAEERDSLEVQALLQLGQAEQARAAAVLFLKTYPQSVFGPTVEAALGE